MDKKETMRILKDLAQNNMYLCDRTIEALKYAINELENGDKNGFVVMCKTWERMCKAHENCCTCPFSTEKPITMELGCGDFVRNAPEIAEEIFKRWEHGHKVKTRKDDFFEKYPYAIATERGLPNLCVVNVGYAKECNGYAEKYTCKDCWNAPVDERKE